MYGRQWDVDDSLGQIGLLEENHYRKLFGNFRSSLSFRPTDKWLDLGANIGAFCVRAAPYCHSVIAVEPEPICIQQLQRNIELNDLTNVTIVPQAAVGGHSGIVDLAISNSYSSTHRVGKIRGRRILEVDSININELVDRFQINKIKMDVEGSEAEILEALRLDGIDELVFEYHFSMLHDGDWSRYFPIIEKIRSAGFEILRGPMRRTKAWHAIVWAVRS